MDFFYLSHLQQANAKPELHRRECSNLPPIKQRQYLGPFPDVGSALEKARLINSSSIICPVCCGTSKSKPIQLKSNQRLFSE